MHQALRRALLVIVALTAFDAAASDEQALLVAVKSALMQMKPTLHGLPTVLAETRQPDAEIVSAFEEQVQDPALLEAIKAPHAVVSLRAAAPPRTRFTTPAEVETVITAGTAEERRARFVKRFPFGILRFSAVGREPKSELRFVTYEWLTARIDKHGDFHLASAELHLVELERRSDLLDGWKVIGQKAAAID
jgi:hypothetical protein